MRAAAAAATTATAGSALPACLPIIFRSWVLVPRQHWHRTKSRPTCIRTDRTALVLTPVTQRLSSAGSLHHQERGGGTQPQKKRGLTLQFRHQPLPQPHPPFSVLSHPYRHRHHHSSLAPPYALVLGGSSHLPGQYMDRSSLFQLIQEQVRKQASEQAATEVSMVTGSRPPHRLPRD